MLAYHVLQNGTGKNSKQGGEGVIRAIWSKCIKKGDIEGSKGILGVSTMAHMPESPMQTNYPCKSSKTLNSKPIKPINCPLVDGFSFTVLGPPRQTCVGAAMPLQVGDLAGGRGF